MPASALRYPPVIGPANMPIRLTPPKIEMARPRLALSVLLARYACRETFHNAAPAPIEIPHITSVMKRMDRLSASIPSPITQIPIIIERRFSMRS